MMPIGGDIVFCCLHERLIDEVDELRVEIKVEDMRIFSYGEVDEWPHFRKSLGDTIRKGGEKGTGMIPRRIRAPEEE